MRTLHSVEEVILILGQGDAVEGRKRVLRMTGQLTQHVTNWIALGKFPARYWVMLSAALAEHDYTMSPKVCGQKPLPRWLREQLKAS